MWRKIRNEVAIRALRTVAGPFLWVIWLAVPAGTLAADGAGLLSQARAEVGAGNLSQAAASFERLLASGWGGEAAGAPPATLHRELGEIYEALGRPDDAAEQYEESLSADPKQRILHYRTGILFRQLANHSKAASHLSEAFEQGFRNTAVRFHLAAAQFAAGRLAAGLENARAILRQGPPNGDLALRVGRLLFQHLFYRDAIEALETALASSEQPLEARFYLALTNHLLNRHERTVELLEPLAGPGGSGNAEVLTLLAAALASIDRFIEAEALLERAIATEPSSPHAYLNLALVLLEQGKTEVAEGWFAKMRLSAGPASPKVFYAIQRNSCGDAYREVAGGAASDSVGASPEQGLQFFEFATNLGARHHHGTAVELLRIAARNATVHELPRPLVLRALAFSCLNLEPASEIPARLLERAIELDPRDHQAHFLLGRSHQERHRPDQAAEAFERAIQVQPDAVPYYTELARSLTSSGLGADEAARAVAILAKAIEIAPSNASARFELGKLHMAQGRLEEASEQLRQAVEAEPEFYEAYYVLGQVNARLRQPDRARENLRMFEAKKAAIDARSTIWKEVVVGLGAE